MPIRADVPLLPSQKNDVFRIVENAGFDPGDFEWQVASVPGPHTVDALVHRAHDEFSFAFDINIARNRSLVPELEPDRISYFSPGAEVIREAVGCHGWDEQLRLAARWLHTLRREVDAVSLWDTLGSETTRQIAAANLSNRPLTREERKVVEVQAEQVRAYLRAHVNDRETLARLEKKVDELLDASKRLGIKDYAMVSLGLLMSMAVGAAFTGAQAQAFVNLFYSGVRLLLGH